MSGTPRNRSKRVVIDDAAVAQARPGGAGARVPITEALLRELAGDKPYERGLTYARDGAVQLEHTNDTRLTATVTGNDDYAVALQWHEGRLAGECDCPIGHTFCKHQVAAALVWSGLAGVDRADRDASTLADFRVARSRPQPAQALPRWLDTLDAAALRALLREIVAQEPELARRLALRAQFALGDAATWRAALGALIGRPRFLDYRASLQYARRVAELPRMLETTLTGDPATALDLAEHALLRLLRIYEQCDDSAGAIGEVLHALGAMHLRAAQAANPEAKAFAKRYLQLRLADGWSVVGEVGVYAEPLGNTGFAALERQAQTRLEALPPRARTWSEHDAARHTLEALLQESAGARGDIDTLLARRAQALHRPWDYLQLAQLCEDHRRERQAVEWLERGLKLHPDDTRLLDALAQAYCRDGFAEDALQLCWRRFEARPDATAYLALRDAAGDAWPQWRQRALALVERRPRAEDQSVQLLLAEGDRAGAWRIAQHGKLGVHTWAQLAPALEDSEPQGALRAYRAVVEASIDEANKRGYATAIEWLRRMAPLHRRLGEDAAFARYLDSLRRQHRAKRNFLAMLEAFAAS